MAGKEKVSFVRSKDFESIDDELAAALDALEETNERIVKLLETEPPPIGMDSGGQMPLDEDPHPEAVPPAEPQA